MNRNNLSLAIATEKLQHATAYGMDSIGFLYCYGRTRDRAADFQHRDARSVCKDSIDRLQVAGMAYLHAGGRKDSEEFRQAAKTRRKLGTIEHALFRDKDFADDARADEKSSVTDLCAWGNTTEFTIRLAA